MYRKKGKFFNFVVTRRRLVNVALVAAAALCGALIFGAEEKNAAVFGAPDALAQSGGISVSVRLSNPENPEKAEKWENVFLLVNGFEKIPFPAEGALTAPLKNGDLLEIDGAKLKKAFVVKVEKVEGGTFLTEENPLRVAGDLKVVGRALGA
jgi:hypothetical protein